MAKPFVRRFLRHEAMEQFPQRNPATLAHQSYTTHFRRKQEPARPCDKLPRQIRDKQFPPAQLRRVTFEQHVRQFFRQCPCR